jgi:hypothetical protein
MRRILFVFLAFLFILLSCKKKKDLPTEEVSCKAGVHDENYNYVELVSFPELNMQWDVQLLYASGKDSIDLDNDGLHDMILTMNYYDEDSAHLISGYPNPFPGFWLTAKNGFEVNCTKEIVYHGMGASTTNYFPDTLSYGQEVTLGQEWHSGSLWGENPIPSQLTFGPWYNVDKIYYLGFRKLISFGNGKIYKYGWIKVDCTNRYEPVFLSYAVRK